MKHVVPLGFSWFSNLQELLEESVDAINDAFTITVAPCGLSECIEQVSKVSRHLIVHVGHINYGQFFEGAWPQFFESTVSRLRMIANDALRNVTIQIHEQWLQLSLGHQHIVEPVEIVDVSGVGLIQPEGESISTPVLDQHSGESCLSGRYQCERFLSTVVPGRPYSLTPARRYASIFVIVPAESSGSTDESSRTR